MKCDYKNCKEEAEMVVHWNNESYNVFCFQHAEKYLSNSEILKEKDIVGTRLL